VACDSLETIPKSSSGTEPARSLFVVHAQADDWFVRGELLPALGLDADDVMLSSELPLGELTLVALERFIDTSRTTVVVVSSAFVSDGWSQYTEQLVHHASVETGHRVVPLLLDGGSRSLWVRARVALDLGERARWDGELAKLVAQLGRASLAIETEGLACPYPGMRPLGAGDAARLYGRDREIEDIVARLAAGQREVVLVGPSGSGKSSLVNAGVLVRMARSSAQRSPVMVRQLRPGQHPAQRLDEVLREGAGEAHAEPAAHVDRLLQAEPADQRLLLIIDQLEEVFALAEPAEREAFFAALLALRAHSRCVLMYCLRADFFADLIVSPLWIEEQGHHLVIGPLSGKALREAVVLPAQRVDVHIEPALVERLLADASGAVHALPLVQEALIQLWELRSRRALPLAAYEQLGEGGANGLVRALSRHADACLSELCPVQRKIARRVLLRLISFGEGSQDSRWPRPRAALELAGEPRAELEAVLEHLTRGRLVVRDARGDHCELLVDLAHEALISSWGQLAGWISARRADGQRRRQLEHTAAAWTARGGGEGGLLEAAELAAAQAWRRTEAARELGESAALAALFDRSAIALRHRWRRSGFTALLSAALVTLLAISFAAVILRGREIETARAKIERAASDRGALVQSSQEQLASHQEDLAREQLQAGRPQRALPHLIAARRQRGDREPSLASGLMFKEATRATLVASLWHEDQLRALALSPDGELVATASADGTARLWHTADGTEATPPLRHGGGAVTCLAFSPDGRHLISGGEDGTARIWSVGGVMVGLPLRHQGPVRVVLFSPDSRRVLTGSADKTARVWDAASGSPVGRPLVHGAAVRNAAFDLHGGLVVTASDDHVARVWRVADGVAVTKPLIHHDNVVAAAISPNARRLLTATPEDSAQVWEIRSGARAFFLPATRGLSAAAYSPDGRQIVIAGSNRSASLWDAQTGAPLNLSLSHDAGVNQAVFSGDGHRILTVSNDKTAIVWDASTGLPLSPRLEHEGAVHLAVLDRTGTVAITAGIESRARLWKLDVPAGELRVFPHDKAVRAVELSADGGWLMTASSDETARLWDVAKGALLMLFQHRARVDLVAIRADRTLVATASDKIVQLWNPLDGQELAMTLVHGDALVGLSFSPDGTRLVTASRDGTAQVWDVERRSKISSPMSVPGQMTSMALSHDGKLLATGLDHGEILFWNLETQEQLPLRFMHGEAVESLQFHRDGARLLAGGKDGRARVWDLASGAMVFEMPHEKKIEAARYSPDGKLIATASRKLVTLWDASSGKLLLQRRTSDGIQALAWSPDGRWLVVGGDQDMAEMWNVEPDARSLQEWIAIGARGAFALDEGRLHVAPRPGAGDPLPPTPGTALASRPEIK
jgi:WD40 repeat protein/energy-coupling factor transporter ATP-binding protein EcfA2